MAWTLVGEGALLPPASGGSSRRYEIAVAAVELAGRPPALFYPAVLVDDAVRMIDPDDGHPTKRAAQAAARPIQAAIRAACAAEGMAVYENVHDILERFLGEDHPSP